MPGMSTDRRIVDFLVDQSIGAGAVSARPMFGEYGLFCDSKMVGIIAGDQLFIKLTPGGRALTAGAEEAAPYPGAKPCLVIEPERWDDGEWMADLVRITAAELPMPKAKAAKKIG
jgi:TfoX/Sxy family transcriptional regulator of competence genes